MGDLGWVLQYLCDDVVRDAFEYMKTLNAELFKSVAGVS